MDISRLAREQEWIRTQLSESVDFWLRHGMDRYNGGICTSLTRRGKIYSTDKSVWMQGRSAWMFSRLCRMYGTRQPWLDAAVSCLDFMEQHCIDRSAQGRMYFTVTVDGRPLRRRRYCFSESFYAIANAEYYALTGSKSHLERARRAYRTVYQLNHGQEDPFGFDAKIIAETRRLRSLADPMIFLNMTDILSRADPENHSLYQKCARECVRDITGFHFLPRLQCTLENVGENGEFLKDISAGRLVNPGHDIECSWFLMEQANSAKDKELHRKAEDMLLYAIRSGWDREYGGLLYFTDCSGFPPEACEHDMKLWWPHTELLTASLMAYRDTGNEVYLNWFYKTLRYCKEHFADSEYGEWYGYLRRDGVPTEPVCKGGLFKGPFHLQRALSMTDRMIDQILSAEQLPHPAANPPPIQ